jgi:ATP/maltotriose-dependent transcriptional regulator MalT
MERGRIETAEAALEEAQAVLGHTEMSRWIAHTLAGLAEVALLRGDDERARELLSEARERYAQRQDTLGVAAVDKRLRSLQSRR